MIIRVSDSAKKELEKMMAREGKPYIRLMVTEYICQGPSWGVNPDQMKEDDVVFEDKGIQFLLEKNDASYITEINVNYNRSLIIGGFQIKVR